MKLGDAKQATGSPSKGYRIDDDYPLLDQKNSNERQESFKREEGTLNQPATRLNRVPPIMPTGMGRPRRVVKEQSHKRL